MTVPLQPPPKNLDRLSLPEQAREIARWMYEVYRRLKDTGLLLISWAGLSRTYATTASNVTMTTDVLKVTAVCTVTLPSANGVSGYLIAVDNAHSGVTTVVPVSGEKIEGETSQTLTGECCFCLYSDGTNWRIQ